MPSMPWAPSKTSHADTVPPQSQRFNFRLPKKRSLSGVPSPSWSGDLSFFQRADVWCPRKHGKTYQNHIFTQWNHEKLTCHLGFLEWNLPKIPADMVGSMVKNRIPGRIPGEGTDEPLMIQPRCELCSTWFVGCSILVSCVGDLNSMVQRRYRSYWDTWIRIGSNFGS